MKTKLMYGKRSGGYLINKEILLEEEGNYNLKEIMEIFLNENIANMTEYISEGIEYGASDIPIREEFWNDIENYEVEYEEVAETRILKIIKTKSGSGSDSFKISLPTPWIRSLGLDKGEMAKVEFDDKKIIISKHDEC